MAERISPYLLRLRQAETRNLWKSMVPAAIWSYRLRRRYRGAFPDAFVSSEALVELDARIGTGSIVRSGCTVSSSVLLGRYSTLGDGCVLRGAGRIEVGPFCSIGPEVVMISENHALDRLTTFPVALYSGSAGSDQEFTPAGIAIGADVWIGQRAIVLAGACIGAGCVVGAGSVVTRGDYEPFTVLAGVPARPVRKRLDERSRRAVLESEWWSAPAERIFGDWRADLQQSHWDDTRALGRS